ncbi:MAG: hypothetical protein FWC41_01245 [Firmicutes bacterium]|nr:hypothetical protein [Bacillota bacterium]
MGLSFYFSGSLRNAEDLPSLIEEIVDISRVYGWKYHIYNPNFPNDAFENNDSFENVYGISFTPTNCETVSLAFLSNGRMISPASISFLAHSEDETERSYIYYVSVKTQFAGIFIHQLLVRLLKHLNDKYFKDFELSDESYYWETDDENLMKERFKLYDSLLDNFVLSMETFPMEKDEDMVAYFERLMKHIQDLKTAK